MNTPSSFFTHWRFNEEMQTGRSVSMPLQLNCVNNDKLILNANTISGQKLSLYRSPIGHLRVFIDDEYQLGVSQNEEEECYGDETHSIYLSALKMLERDIPSDRILIIGGGDLGLASLLLDNGATGVKCFELDHQLVTILSEYISFTNKALNNPNVDITYGDGFELIKTCKDNSFDIIIGDLTDKGAFKFNDSEVHKELIRVCSPDGAIMTHYCSGGLDLNVIFANFYQDHHPDFLCITDADPDHRSLWSTNQIERVDYFAS